MNEIALAYLAGAMDSDGHFSIRRTTYHMRVRKDAHNPVFSEQIGLKQIKSIVPKLLQDTFGGSLYQSKPQTDNSYGLWCFSATDLKAAQACECLLPYLRVKRHQAQLLLELRESKQPKYRKIPYWFELEYPDWQKMELITYSEVAKILNYKNTTMVSQAVCNGTLLALPYHYNGKAGERPRVPKKLIEIVLEMLGSDGRIRQLPPQLLSWRESLWRQTKELNKIGIYGTPIYYRSGPYTPK